MNNPARIEPDTEDATMEHRLATIPELAKRVKDEKLKRMQFETVGN